MPALEPTPNEQLLALINELTKTVNRLNETVQDLTKRVQRLELEKETEREQMRSVLKQVRTNRHGLSVNNMTTFVFIGCFLAMGLIILVGLRVDNGVFSYDDPIVQLKPLFEIPAVGALVTASLGYLAYKIREKTNAPESENRRKDPYVSEENRSSVE